MTTQVLDPTQGLDSAGSEGSVEVPRVRPKYRDEAQWMHDLRDASPARITKLPAGLWNRGFLSQLTKVNPVFVMTGAVPLNAVMDSRGGIISAVEAAESALQGKLDLPLLQLSRSTDRAMHCAGLRRLADPCVAEIRRRNDQIAYRTFAGQHAFAVGIPYAATLMGMLCEEIASLREQNAALQDKTRQAQDAAAASSVSAACAASVASVSCADHPGLISDLECLAGAVQAAVDGIEREIEELVDPAPVQAPATKAELPVDPADDPSSSSSSSGLSWVARAIDAMSAGVRRRAAAPAKPAASAPEPQRELGA